MLAAERRTGSGPVLFLLLVAAVLALALVFAFRDIPMTRHAANEHTGQKWDAVSIAEYFDQGRCIPREYACAAQDYNVFYCEISPGKAIGLLVGRTVEQIITGYPGSTSYWENRCNP